jgi:hypothetical protein
MEFQSVRGKNHLIQPIGYCEVRKTRIVGSKVRSIQEQFLIHQVAYEFESPLLCIPKPIRLEETSYTMEQIWAGSYLPPLVIPYFPLLVSELRRFRDFLVSRNLYPIGFTILQIGPESIERWARTPSTPQFALVDTSHFGVIQGSWVSIPKLCITTLNEMNTFFEVFLSKKEEASLQEELLDHPDLPFAKFLPPS